MPSSAHSCVPSGTRARKASAASSTAPPAKGEVTISPPARPDASRTRTDAPRATPSQAAASPLTPPPTTTRSTSAPALTASHPGRRPPHPVGQGGEHGGLVVDRRRAGEGEPQVGGEPGGVHVEVVEDLQVVGHEPLRAHEHALDPAGGGQRPDHLEDIGAAPRLGR